MNRVLILIVLTCISKGLLAQKLSDFSIAGMSEAVGLPFTNYLPVHPGIEMTGTFKRVEKLSSDQFLKGKVGFFHHERVALAIYTGIEYQYSKKIFSQKMSLDFPMGLGYLHTIYPGELYEIRDGELVEVNKFGRAHLYTNIGVGLTYLKNEKIKPFIRQELFAEIFGNAISVIPHSLLKVGVQINITKNE